MIIEDYWLLSGQRRLALALKQGIEAVGLRLLVSGIEVIPDEQNN